MFYFFTETFFHERKNPKHQILARINNMAGIQGIQEMKYNEKEVLQTIIFLRFFSRVLGE